MARRRIAASQAFSASVFGAGRTRLCQIGPSAWRPRICPKYALRFDRSRCRAHARPPPAVHQGSPARSFGAGIEQIRAKQDAILLAFAGRLQTALELAQVLAASAQ